ncbi:MAG: hypothetical protein ACO395_06690 [Pontimonas sp.]
MTDKSTLPQQLRNAKAQQLRSLQALLTVERLTASDFRWVSHAIRHAERSEHRVRVGATLVSGTRIASSCNRIRNNPTISYVHATTHAEVGAIKKAIKARGGTIYVARLGANGGLLPSFPCARCFPQIADAGIKRIVWWNGERWVKGKL